jgi:uncharacterized membrane protein
VVNDSRLCKGGRVVTDILIASACCLFIIADFKQVQKLMIVKENVGVSETKYWLRLFALILLLTAYSLLSLPLSIGVNLINMASTVVILYLLRKYRRK